MLELSSLTVQSLFNSALLWIRGSKHWTRLTWHYRTSSRRFIYMSSQYKLWYKLYTQCYRRHLAFFLTDFKWVHSNSKGIKGAALTDEQLTETSKAPFKVLFQKPGDSQATWWTIVANKLTANILTSWDHAKSWTHTVLFSYSLRSGRWLKLMSCRASSLANRRLGPVYLKIILLKCPPARHL